MWCTHLHLWTTHQQNEPVISLSKLFYDVLIHCDNRAAACRKLASASTHLCSPKWVHKERFQHWIIAGIIVQKWQAITQVWACMAFCEMDCAAFGVVATRCNCNFRAIALTPADFAEGNGNCNRPTSFEEGLVHHWDDGSTWIKENLFKSNAIGVWCRSRSHILNWQDDSW